MGSNDKGKIGASAILLMLLMGLISLVLLVVFIGFTLWFWILLILWILFALIFYFKFLAFIAVTSISIWISFIILIIFSITMMFVGGSDSSSGDSKNSGSSLVSCTSDGSDSPVTISGWSGNIISQPINSHDNIDTGVRTFSIKSLDAKTGTGLYYILDKDDGGNVTGAKGLIEVCDSNNMTKKYETTKDTTTTPASEGATAVYYYLHGNKRVTAPGTYRVDAWANVDGSWKLVDREVGVTFTE